MPSFLSKVFGRKKDEKGSSPVQGRGYDGASLLEGKFEVISPVTSPTIGDFPESSSRSRRTEGGSGFSNVKSPGTSPKPSNGKDEFPQLPLSFSHSREEDPAHALGTGFESYSDAKFLSDIAISDRRLTPLEALILVRICSQAIVARGLETLGLMHPHWHSASPETQHRLVSLFIRSLNTHPPQSSADSPPFSLFESEINYTLSPHDVAAVLRWGLRHLELGPDGFGKDKTWYQTFAETERKAGYSPQSYSETLTQLIPTTHLELLDATLDLFSSLAAHSEENSTSASKLTKAFGFWLLIAQRDRERDDWTGFYDGWQSSGRILEHVFLARIRDQSLKTRMPTRLTGLVARYPYIEGEKMEDDIFLHPQLSTRHFEALLVRVESEISSKEAAHRHPLQLVKDALVAQVMSVDDNELVSFWEKIKKSGNDEGEVTPGGYSGISRIFADDTLRYLSLVPGNHPWKKSTSPTFNLKEVQDSPIFRRLASSPGSSENEGLNGSNTNGHAKYNNDPASPSSAATSTSPNDWFQFSSAGFTDASPSTVPLASTLFGQDVEKTHPPSRNKRHSRIRSRSPSRSRKSTERAASPPPPPVPPVPDLPQQYTQKPIFKTTTISLVKIDEAFIDFWVDALLDSISSNWPKIVVCKLKSDLPDRMVNDQRVEYIIIEHVKRLIATPPPPPPQPVPQTESTAPIAIPSTPIERNNLERLISPTKSLPSSPRSFKSETQRFFNFFSSSISGSRNSTIYPSATTGGGQKQKEAASERGVGDFGEMGKEKEGKSSSIVKLRMPSPRARKSMDAPRRSVDMRSSFNVDASEQVRGRSTGEKKEMGKLKEVEVEKKEGEEKMVRETENKEEVEGEKREVEEKEHEEKKGEEVDDKRGAVEKVEENKTKEVEEKKRKDSPSEIPSIATSAVTAAAVAVAAVTVGESQQATSQEDAGITEDVRSVEQQTEETVANEEPREEEITPIDSDVANLEEQPARALETIVESPTATEPTLALDENPTATEPAPVLEGQTLSTPSQQKIDTAADFSEFEVIEEPTIQPSAPQESDIDVAAQPIEEEKLVSETVAPEPVAEVIEELVSPEEEPSAPQPVVVEATPSPIAAEEHAEPAAFSPPGLEPQVAVVENTQEPEAAAVLLETTEEDLASQAVSAGTAVSVAFPVSGPTVAELTPVAEEPIEDADAAIEEPIVTKASPAVQEPVAAEEFLVIEGPAAFDPSDIDAQVDELNAQMSEETGDSEPTSEEDSESVVTEEGLPVDVEVLASIQETNEGPTEDSINDIVVVEEPAVLEPAVEETTLAPSVSSVDEATAPSPIAETPVAEEKDEDVPVIEEEEEVAAEAEAEAEAAPVQEESIDEVTPMTESLEEPASPVVEPSSLPADEQHTDENPTVTAAATASEEPVLEEVIEEPATIDAPIQEVPSEPVVAVEPAPVEESTNTDEEAEVEKVVPAVEEDHLVGDVIAEEDPVTEVPTAEESALGDSVPDAAPLDEHHAAEEPAAVDNTEAAILEQPVAGGVSNEASSSDVVPGDQPTAVEEPMEIPAEREPSIDQSAVAESAPVEHVAFEEPEVIEGPPAQEQDDESRPIEVIKESSAEELQAPAAGTTAVAEEDVIEVAKAEEPTVIDEPAIEDHPTEPAKEPVAEPSTVEEPPVLVEEPSTPQPTEAAHAHGVLERPITPATLPVSEVTVAETPALEDEVPVQVTQPIDTTPVIDEDAIDAAATKPEEPTATPSTTAVAEEHEGMATSPDEPSTPVLDDKIVVSNGDAEHVPDSGVANGNGHHATIIEKESTSTEDQPPSVHDQGPEHRSDELSGSVPVLVED